MLKHSLIVLCLLLFNSCCYKGTVTTYNQPRKEIAINKTHNSNIYNIVDTLALYREYKMIRKNNGEEYYPNFGLNYIRFYGKGKISKFNWVGYDNEQNKLK